MANIIQGHSDSVSLIDSNNNCAQKGYSLRPRLIQKRLEEDDLPEKKTGKPKCRSRGRLQLQAHPPLSKYRRKTANARERSRMREINEAFETLRRAVPTATSTGETHQSEKMTKISTLRLAMDYISALHRVLQNTEGPDVFSDLTEDFSSASLIHRTDHSCSPPPYPNISYPSSTLQCNAITHFHDLSLTSSEITDHSLSSTSEESDLLMISIDFDSLSKDPVLSTLNSPVTDRTFSTQDQTFCVSNFQDQCSVFDEVLFLTSSS